MSKVVSLLFICLLITKQNKTLQLEGSSNYKTDHLIDKLQTVLYGSHCMGDWRCDISMNTLEHKTVKLSKAVAATIDA